jgi:hypothetical protein
VATPPPIWVNRFYSALSCGRGLFPTRGQRHGAAIRRGGSQRSDKSFGASQIPTPSPEWASERSKDDMGGNSTWTMIDPSHAGRSLDDQYHTGSRYPTITPQVRKQNDGPRLGTGQPVYPRPMSRAPTLREGIRLPPLNPFDAPLVPSKRDSVDYLQSKRASGNTNDETIRVDSQAKSNSMRVWSPGGSSSASFSRAEVGNVSKAKTGTAALAAILANMNRDREGRYRLDAEEDGEEGQSPFDSPFDEEPTEKSRRV